MITARRIFQTRFSANWADGEGAFRYGGRWNSSGRRVLYASDSLALSALEIFVHLNSRPAAKSGAILADYSFADISFGADAVVNVEQLAHLPENWREHPNDETVRNIGDEWIANGTSPVLRVPTAILPIEFNYLVNLGHKDIGKVNFGKPEGFVFDPRLR